MPFESSIAAASKSAESRASSAKPANPAINELDSAVELLPGNQTKPLAKLSAGDHSIQFKGGRQFLVHVPNKAENETLPVMFILSGAAQPQWDIRDFARESGMNQLADAPGHKFIAVYPLPVKHLIGQYSKDPAYAWNAEGSLIDKSDLKFAGYDDMAFVKSVANLIPQLADVDKSHKDWGAIAWSQGGPFLNALVSKEPNLFPSIGLVGSTMQTNYRYEMRPGNAQNVVIVNLLDDKITLPVSGGYKYHERAIFAEIFRHLGRKDLVERASPLAAIDNVHQDPLLQEKYYAANLFPRGSHYKVGKYSLSTPTQSSKKDYVKEYRSADNESSIHSLTVFNLPGAKHSYPGPLRDNARTNAQEKYLEFDASAEFAKLFNSYNDRVHKSQQK